MFGSVLMSEMREMKPNMAGTITKHLLFPSSSIRELAIDFVILP
jgi:hypothetical protein